MPYYSEPKVEEPPAKLLDDLFRKTKAAPCIYWLPLTDEQVINLCMSFDIGCHIKNNKNDKQHHVFIGFHSLMTKYLIYTQVLMLNICG